MIPFWPKIAGVEDAPNYRPTASDARCETCSYFRALNDGAGYCEKFSFEAEPESVCDDFLEAGRAKVASVTSRLSEIFKNPVTHRVGLSAGAGALAGAGVGAKGSGDDAVREGARGAAVGGIAGAVLGGIGPTSRLSKARSAFSKTVQTEMGDHKKAISDLQKSIASYASQTEDLKKAYSSTMSQINDLMTNDIQSLKQSVSNSQTAYRDLRKAKGPKDQNTLIAKAYLNEHLKELRAKEQQVMSLRSELQKMKKDRADILESKNEAVASVGDRRAKIEELRLLTFEPNYKDISDAKALERYGVPTLSGLVGAGLGFGVSHRSKEHEKFRKSKN